MTRRFESPAAFRQALEQRPRTTAEARGVDLNSLRLKLLIERLLARLFAEPDAPWRLKGGFAMELRLREGARTTKDLDLAFPSAGVSEEGTADLDAIRERLQAAAERDLGDHLVYRMGAASRQIEAAPQGGGRFPVVVSLAGREYGRFGVDVGIGPDTFGPPERLVGDDLLGFADIEPAVALAVPREAQFAEKIMAYTRPWGDRVNTRTKDLVDLLLLIDLGLDDERALRRALSESIRARPGRDLPHALPEPPASWAAVFEAMAHEAGLDVADLTAAYARLADFWRERRLGDLSSER
ncbi:MAG: nucleotidyl transferase AbiEii/AbiGii toxin family protein [Planctomycetota bacterium]|jgi:hypothetical protein